MNFIGYDLKERTIAEFLHNKPEQQFLKKLEFVENAYFYRPNGFVYDVFNACHNTTECNPISIYYNLDTKKIIWRNKQIIRKTKINYPAKPQVPSYPKTKD